MTNGYILNFSPGSARTQVDFALAKMLEKLPLFIEFILKWLAMIFHSIMASPHETWFAAYSIRLQLNHQTRSDKCKWQNREKDWTVHLPLEITQTRNPVSMRHPLRERETRHCSACTIRFVQMYLFHARFAVPIERQKRNSSSPSPRSR